MLQEQFVVPETATEAFVAYALSIGALELLPEGRPLKSGRISPYFFNSGLFSTGDSLNMLTDAYLSVVVEQFQGRFDVLFGPAYKGITIASSVALKYWICLDENIGFAFDRKEAKDHGEGGEIIGTPLRGKRVLIVDDVITAGESKRYSVELVKAHGGTPVGCVIAFDRQEKGFDTQRKVDLTTSAAQQFEQMFGIPLVAAAALNDLISFLTRTGTEKGSAFVGDMLSKIITYQKQYGV